MRRTVAPIASWSRALALSLLATLPALAVDARRPAPPPPTGISAVDVAGDLLKDEVNQLREDILGRLKGRNNLTIEDLEKRLKESESGLKGSSSLLANAGHAGLRIEIENLSALLKNARVHIAAGPGTSPARLEPLLNALDGQSKKEKTDTVVLLLGGLNGAAENPLQASWVFERMRLSLKGNQQALAELNSLESEMARKAAEYSDPASPAIFGVKPSDIQLTVKSLEASDTLGLSPPTGGFLNVVQTAASPFRQLLPDARERKFIEERSTKRSSLEIQARDAIMASGGDVSTSAEGAELIGRLKGLEEGAFQQLGFQSPARSAEEHHDRLKAVIGRFPALGLYLVNLARYRMFLQDALQEEAIPVGTVLESWEMGEGAPVGAKVTFHAENYDGEIYKGLRYSFADGSVKFQGKSVGTGRGLLTVSDPRESRTVKTRIEFAQNREPLKTDTVVFDDKTGRRVRRELVDMAKRLTTVTSFDGLGDEVREETLVQDTGTRTVKDWEQGLVITTEKDRSASIVPIAGKSGKAPFKAQYGTFDKDGRFSVNKVVLSDDKIQLRLSEHVIKILGADQKLLGYEIQLGDYIGLSAGEARAQKGRSLAAETLKALGIADNDGALSIPLANFLFDFAKPHAGSRGLSLTVDERQNFNLVVEMQDGTKEIYNGRIAPGTSYKGKVSRGSFVLMGKIKVDAKGQGSQDPRRWLEYTAEGNRLQWKERFSETKGEWYKPWKADEKITHVLLIQEAWTGTLANGHWTEKGEEEHKKIATEVSGSSTFGKIGGGIMSVPVLSHILDGGGKVGKSLYTGLIAAPQVFAAKVDLFGIGDDYLLEATASYYKNPAMRALMDEADYLRKLTPGARSMLDARAISNRREALERQGIDAHRAPEAYRQAMEMKVSNEEALAALNNFGAGSYGARLIAEGGMVTGNSWGDKAQSFALTAGGVLTGAFETVAETTFNPVVWATFGLGRAVTALQGSSTLMGSARLLNVTLVSAKVTHTVLAGTLMTAWGAGALDNLGKTFQYYGEDRQKFYETLGHLGADVFFGALMYKEWRDSARDAKAQAALKEKARLDSLFKEATDAVAKSAAEKASATLDNVQASLNTARQQGARLTTEAQVKAAEGAKPIETAKPIEAAKPTGTAKPLETGKVAEAKAPATAQGKGWFEGLKEAMGLKESGKVKTEKPAQKTLAQEKTTPTEAKPAAEAPSLAKGGKGYWDGFLDLFRRSEKVAEKPTKAVQLAEAPKTTPKPWYERIGDRLVDGAKKPVSTYPKLPDPEMLTAPQFEPLREDPAPPINENPPMPDDSKGDTKPVTDDTPMPPSEVQETRKKPENRPVNREESIQEPVRQTPPVQEVSPITPVQTPSPVSSNSDPVATTASSDAGSSGGDGGGNKAAGLKAPSGNPFGGGSSAGGGDAGGAGGGGGGGGKSQVADSVAPKGNPFGNAPAAASPAAPVAAAFNGGPTPMAKPAAPPPQKPLPAAANNLTSPAETKPSIASRFDGSKDVKTPLVAKTDTASFASPSGVWSTMDFKPKTAPPTPPEAAREEAPSVQYSRPVSAPSVLDVPRPENEDFSYTYMAPARQKYEMSDARSAGTPPWYMDWLSLGLKISAAMAMSSLMFKSDLPYLTGLSKRKRDERA